MPRLLGGEAVPPADYYFRTTPYFETSSEKYAWLNKIVAGRGRSAGFVERLGRLQSLRGWLSLHFGVSISCGPAGVRFADAELLGCSRDVSTDDDTTVLDVSRRSSVQILEQTNRYVPYAFNIAMSSG